MRLTSAQAALLRDVHDNGPVPCGVGGAYEMVTAQCLERKGLVLVRVLGPDVGTVVRLTLLGEDEVVSVPQEASARSIQTINNWRDHWEDE